MNKKMISLSVLASAIALIGNPVAMEMPVDKPFKFTNYGTKAEAGDGVARVNIYDRIGNSFWEDGVTAKEFAAELKTVGNRELNVHISTNGGDTREGTVMYNDLISRKGVTNTIVDGYAISMGSILALAGKNSGKGKSKMLSNALFMMHKPLTMIGGNADELRAGADLLDTVESALAQPYMDASGKDNKEIADMLRATTWLTAQEALEHGFIDEIIESNVEITNCFDMNTIQNYKNVPDAFIKQFVDQEGNSEDKDQIVITMEGADGKKLNKWLEDNKELIVSAINDNKSIGFADDDGKITLEGVDNGVLAKWIESNSKMIVDSIKNPVTVESERKRTSAISKMCSEQGFEHKTQYFIDKGTSLEDAQSFIIELKAAVDETIDNKPPESSKGGGDVEGGNWANAYKRYNNKA